MTISAIPVRCGEPLVNQCLAALRSLVIPLEIVGWRVAPSYTIGAATKLRDWWREVAYPYEASHIVGSTAADRNKAGAKPAIAHLFWERRWVASL
jgi:hypothetical protein